ncbi:MAG: hypothetical protein R6V01_06110 [Thermoplasmatota archaeon]
MLTEDEVFQAIYDHAMENYGQLLESLWERHDQQNPVSLLPPGEPRYKDFMCQVIYELPFTENGVTIAEEFAHVSKDIDDRMKNNILQIKHMIRSQFRVISVNDRYLDVKDIKSGIDHRVMRGAEGPPISKGSMIRGRIHPFGDHYRFTGIITVSDSPLESGMDAFMESILGNFLKNLEEMPFRPSTSFKTIMKKYPANWVDRISRTYRIKKRLKKDKIEAILEKITKDTDSILSKLSPEAKEILGMCMERGGYAKMMLLGDIKDDTTYFQEKKSRTPMGELRQKGLIFIGRMKIERRNYKVAFVPREIRESIEPFFHVKQRGTNRTLDDIFSQK